MTLIQNEPAKYYGDVGWMILLSMQKCDVFTYS